MYKALSIPRQAAGFFLSGRAFLFLQKMEATISASQGAMRSLPRKLESLLSGPKHELRAAEKKKLRGLQADLQELIDNNLFEPSEVVFPASTANSWMKDVRVLSYDIDDFIYELAHVVGGGARISVVQKPPRFKICLFPEKLRRRQWITNEVLRFRTRVKEAIRLHEECLSNCKWRPSSSGQPPPSPCVHLVGVDSSIQQLCGWLANDGQPGHRVVSIVGTGGVGKTTLAREVYRRLGAQFQCRAFVRTSPKTDMQGLLTSVLSQVQRHRHLPDDALDVHKLVININKYLRDKTYLVVIEDLWALSTWDLVNRALPKGICCSRILTTTEVEVIAQTCCTDNSKYISAKKEDKSKYMPLKEKNNPKYMPSTKENKSMYIIKKEPLSEDESRELFSNRAFGKQVECPQGLREVSDEIIKRSGGFPLGINILASLLAHHPASSIEQWNYIKNSLSSDLTTHASWEKINQVLNIGYDNLPHDLKACMLYLCLYEEDLIIRKDDLVKQWIAEGFISAVKGDDEEQVAHINFGELVNRGMIQPVDTNCGDEILSCRVHHMVLHFIRDKSMEENFCIAIDHSQTTIRLADKVRRLALHLSNVEDATPPGPQSMRLSKVRSVAFSGFHKCMPSIVEFRFLQVLNLKLSVNPDKIMSHNLTGSAVLNGNITESDGLSYNLTEISELFRLRYFHLEACHMRVALPTQMQKLKDLVAWEIDAEVTTVPSDIADLPTLLYLRIPSDTHLPTSIGRMTSLRTLGVFDLSKNSTEDVMSLCELTNLQDLRLTCSTLQPYNLEKNLECLGSVIRKLSNLKCVSLVPAVSSQINTQHDSSASSMSTSWNGVNIVPLSPALLQRLELSRLCCLFSSLPEWTIELTKLCILRIAVRKVAQDDLVILKGLPSLTALSLFIWTAPAIRITFDNEGFVVLKYFNFVCAAPCLEFLDGAMPKVRKLKLGFNANRMDRIIGLKRLTGLKEVSIKIGDPGAVERKRETAHLMLTDAIGMHPSNPIINVRWVDWNFCGDNEKDIKPQKEIQYQTLEQQNVIVGASSAEHGIKEKNLEGDAKKQPDTRTYATPESPFSLQNTLMESSDEHGVKEKNLEEDAKKQPDTRTYATPESPFPLQNTDVIVGESSDEHGIKEKNLEEDAKKQPDTRTYATPESPFPLQNTLGESLDEHGIKEKSLEEDAKKQPDTRTHATPKSPFPLQNTDNMGTRVASALSKALLEGYVKYPWEQKMRKSLCTPNSSSWFSMLILPKALDLNTCRYESSEDTLDRANTWLYSSQASGIPIQFMNLQSEGLLTKISGETEIPTVNSGSLSDMSNLVNATLYGFEDIGVVKAARIWYRSTAGEIPLEIQLQEGDTRLGFSVSRTEEGFIYISSVVEDDKGNEAPSTRSGLRDLFNRAKEASKLLIISRVSNEKVLPWMISSSGSVRCFDTISLSQKLSLHRLALQPIQLHLLMWEKPVGSVIHSPKPFPPLLTQVPFNFVESIEPGVDVEGDNVGDLSFRLLDSPTSSWV